MRLLIASAFVFFFLLAIGVLMLPPLAGFCVGLAIPVVVLVAGSILPEILR